MKVGEFPNFGRLVRVHATKLNCPAAPLGVHGNYFCHAVRSHLVQFRDVV